MPDQYTKQQFAARIRANSPGQYDGQDDDAVVKSWLTSYPGDAKYLAPEKSLPTRIFEGTFSKPAAAVVTGSDPEAYKKGVAKAVGAPAPLKDEFLFDMGFAPVSANPFSEYGRRNFWRPLGDVAKHLTSMDPEVMGATVKGFGQGVAEKLANSSISDIIDYASMGLLRVPGTVLKGGKEVPTALKGLPNPVGFFKPGMASAATPVQKVAGLANVVQSGALGLKGVDDIREGNFLGGLFELGMGAGGVMGMAGDAGEIVKARRAVKQVQSGLTPLESLDAKRAADLAAREAQEKPGRWAKLRENYVDQAAPIEDWVKGKLGEIKGAGRNVTLTDEQNPLNVYHVVSGGEIGGKIANMQQDYERLAEEMRQNGVFDLTRNYTDIMGMLHYARYFGQKSKGAKAKLGKGEALPEQLETQQLLTMYRDLANQLRASGKFDLVKGYAKQVFDKNREMLDYAHANGLISDDIWKTLRKRNLAYVPLNRLFPDLEMAGNFYGGKSLDMGKQKILYERSGSERATENPFVASFKRGAETIKEAGKNAITSSIANLRTVDPIFAADIKPVKAGHMPTTGKGLIHTYENGERLTYEVPKAIADVFQDTRHAQAFGKFFNFINRHSRAFMTTYSAGFIPANVIRDVSDMRKLSGEAKKLEIWNPKTYTPWAKDVGSFVKEWASAAKSAWTKDDDYRAMLDAGGGFSTWTHNINPDKVMVAPGERGDSTRLAKFLEGTLGRVASATEEATKLANFKRSKAKGMSDFEAALETRRFGGSPDFGRKGRLGADANNLIMFFNAQIQGLSRNARALNPSTPEGRERLMKLSANAAVAQFALQTHNRQYVDPDGTRTWDRIADSEKQNNFIFVMPWTYKTGKGVERHAYYKIPKGHIARLIHNPIENMVGAMMGDAKAKEAELSGQSVYDIASNLLPGSVNLKAGDVVQSGVRGLVSSLNPAIKVPFELAWNKDTYRDLPIVPEGMQALPSEMQAHPQTSDTLKGIAKSDIAKSLHASPLQLEHALKSFIPTFGEQVLGPLDYIKGQRNPFKEAPLGPLQGLVNPVTRRFTASDIDQIETDRLKGFYNTYDEIDGLRKQLLYLKKNNPEAARLFMQENREMLGMYPALTKAAQRLAKVRQQRNRIIASKAENTKEMLEKNAAMEHEVLAQIDAFLQKRKPQPREY